LEHALHPEEHIVEHDVIECAEVLNSLLVESGERLDSADAQIVGERLLIYGNVLQYLVDVHDSDGLLGDLRLQDLGLALLGLLYAYTHVLHIGHQHANAVLVPGDQQRQQPGLFALNLSPYKLDQIWSVQVALQPVQALQRGPRQASCHILSGSVWLQQNNS
jgi:hypothetical protein